MLLRFFFTEELNFRGRLGGVAEDSLRDVVARMNFHNMGARSA